MSTQIVCDLCGETLDSAGRWNRILAADRRRFVLTHSRYLPRVRKMSVPKTIDVHAECVVKLFGVKGAGDAEA